MTICDPERLSKLQSYQILDTPPDERFDRIARLVARSFTVPMVGISFVDRRRVWFKSTIGFDVRQVPLDQFHCSQVVAEDRFLEISDGVSPPVVSHSPSGGLPATRFYAGAPLRTNDGFVLGSICIFDEKFRRLRPSERHSLESMADFVVDELEQFKSLQRNQVETEVLKSSERHFRELLDIAPILVWMTDAVWQSVYFNTNWLNFTGRSLVEELGSGWERGLHRDDIKRCHETFTESTQNRNVYSIEYRLRRHDGEYRWLLESGRPRFDADDAFLGCVGGAVDITDLKVAEARLEARTRELERSNSALEQFASVAAHDLKAPLRHIVAFSEILKTEYGETLDEQGRLCVEQMAAASLRMRNMVSSLLELSRISLASNESGFAATSLVDVISRAHANVGLAALDVHHGDLPEVYGARSLLIQLFHNLFDNAVKYAVDTKADVTVEASMTEDTVEVSVSDKGPGIDAENADLIFQLFKRLANKAEVSGSGIGLALCSRIIALHGGKIWLDDSYKGGARFRFTLNSPTSEHILMQCAPDAVATGAGETDS